MRATTPATFGVAKLVPLIYTWLPQVLCSAYVQVVQFVVSTDDPGALTSTFGPQLDQLLNSSFTWVALTETTFARLAG
jgi:hypothetical protein